MHRMTYAEAAAAAGSSGEQQPRHQQQQTSTGTSPSVCSSSSSREGREESNHAAATRSPPIPAAPSATASPPPASASGEPVGANPGTVKLLKEQFERQGSDVSLANASRHRLPAAAPPGAPAAAESSSRAEDTRPWELLADAKACAEAIDKLLEEKKQLQQQVESLWNQKEAFRCANERISKVLLRQQQQQPAAELAAAAEAAGATPRKDYHRPVNCVPPGCFTARGPRGPHLSRGSPRHLSEAPPPLDLTAINKQKQLVLQQQPQQQQQPKKKAAGIPAVTALNLRAVQRHAEAAAVPRGPPLPGAGVSFREGPAGRPLGGPQMGGALTCRASLAYSALKTPRRRFGDGGISARSGGSSIQRRASGELLHQQQEQQQHAAIEEALVASMRSMNMLGLGGSSTTRKTARATAAATAAAGQWEPTPEAALIRCSSTPEKGFWHSTFLCVLKVEGTDLFLDAVESHQQQLRPAQRSGSYFFSNSNSPGRDGQGGSPFLNGARIFASKETAVDATRLPPDQTLKHGLSTEETQAGALGVAVRSSSPSDTSQEEEEGAAADGTRNTNSSSLWSGWDAVAFMYQRSIDASGTPIPGKTATPSQNLYISSRIHESSRSGMSPSRSNSSSSSNHNSNSTTTTSSNSGKTNVGSTTADLRRAVPYTAENQLILQSGQADEQLFIVRAKDRHTGVMPLFHQVTQKYLSIHPTMGLVGLIPPVIEQERQLRLQQKADQQQKKKAKRRLRARRQSETQPQQQQQERGGTSSNGSNTTPNTPDTSGEPISPELLLRPCRIEMIPLADLLVQQSVQRVLSTVQEAALQLQQQSYVEEACGGPIPAGVAATGNSIPTSESASDAEDSFDGVVASEGAEDTDPSKGGARSRRPLVPPLGHMAAAATSEDSSPASQPPVVLEFRLDDEGVETEAEEGVETEAEEGYRALRTSNSRGSSPGDCQGFDSSTSVEPAKP